MQPKPVNTIPEYIAQYQGDVKTRLETLYTLMKQELPQAQQRISWGMPTFWQWGNLVHFAAGKNHIGLYPGPSGVQHFLPELQGYKTSKGAIQLPNAQPLPLELVRRIVRFRLQENTLAHAEKEK